MIKKFQVANFEPLRSSVKEVELWINQKPPWYKINTDGAVFTQQWATGVGVVICDHESRVVTKLSKRLHYP